MSPGICEADIPKCKLDSECNDDQLSCVDGKCINKCAFTSCLAPSKCLKGVCYALDYCFIDK